MKKIFALSGLAAAFMLAGGAAQALPTTVFSNDFSVNTNGFSSGSLSNSKAAGGTDLTQFHGNFLSAGSTLTVDLTGQAHTQVSLKFDLYLFSSWDGVANDFTWKAVAFKADVIQPDRLPQISMSIRTLM